MESGATVGDDRLHSSRLEEAASRHDQNPRSGSVVFPGGGATGLVLPTFVGGGGADLAVAEGTVLAAELVGGPPTTIGGASVPVAGAETQAAGFAVTTAGEVADAAAAGSLIGGVSFWLRENKKNPVTESATRIDAAIAIQAPGPRRAPRAALRVAPPSVAARKPAAGPLGAAIVSPSSAVTAFTSRRSGIDVGAGTSLSPMDAAKLSASSRADANRPSSSRVNALSKKTSSAGGVAVRSALGFAKIPLSMAMHSDAKFSASKGTRPVTHR